ncbi:hypothetical protein J2X20_004775 [Pelomonas saccharophila]|uniref:Phosphate ABC transporter substrate-binding protein n=1 Tax=Roseateles saccharophilus TaxID=304 RepID=A0ABU1YTA9_ROSSA|nr:hypothetical protein [Roseateles saccharophilus]MDR7272101.1 hypothetical protein [Roseateles saccharophilus]
MALRSLLSKLGALALLASALPAHADFYIVVHANNPQRSLTQKEAVDLFMGRTRAFANGDFALIFDLPRDNPRRAAFYQALTGMSVAQVNSYWSRLMFSGQSAPPQALADEAAMAGMLRRNPGALGWLSREPTEPGLRSVLVIREAGSP